MKSETKCLSLLFLISVIVIVLIFYVILSNNIDDIEADIVNIESNDEGILITDKEHKISDTDILLTKSISVTFIKDTTRLSNSEKSFDALDEFIDIAKTLDNAIIEISGNTDSNSDSDSEDEYNIKLSKQRADAIKQYFISNGISADRIITVGNGSDNPIVDNDTEEHRAMNRRVDISFKIIE